MLKKKVVRWFYWNLLYKTIMKNKINPYYWIHLFSQLPLSSQNFLNFPKKIKKLRLIYVPCAVDCRWARGSSRTSLRRPGKNRVPRAVCRAWWCADRSRSKRERSRRSDPPRCPSRSCRRRRRPCPVSRQPRRPVWPRGCRSRWSIGNQWTRPCDRANRPVRCETLWSASPVLASNRPMLICNWHDLILTMLWGIFSR